MRTAAVATDQPIDRRVFVGIKVAFEVAQMLAEFARDLASLGARLVPASDIHLTLVPPWSEIQPAEAIARLRAVAGEYGGFVLKFKRVRFGPRLRRPRLLWVECEPNKALKDLQTTLMATYGQIDSRPFVPHVTLARLPRNGCAIVRRRSIDQSLALTQHIISVELFQSPAKGEHGYQILASVPLKVDPTFGAQIS